MKKQRKEIVLFFAGTFVLLAILLLCATDIVLAGSGMSVKKTNFVEHDIDKIVYYDVFYTRVRGGISDVVDIAGYAFMETDIPNPDKKIDLYLVSDRNTYKIGTVMGDNWGINAENFGKNIQGTHHMFSAVFSYAQIEDGVYTLLIDCYENESCSGYVSTRIAFQKEGRSFTPLSEYQGVLQTDVSILEAMEENLLYHSIGMCRKNNNMVQIFGWAAIDDHLSNAAKVMIALTDENGETRVYDTVQFTRYYLQEAIERDMYDNASFYTNIPLTDLTPGTYYTLSVLVQADSLCIARYKYKLIYQPEEEKEITLIRGYGGPISTRQDIALSEFSPKDMLYHSIDECKLSDGVLQLTGWGLEVGTPSDQAKVLIGLTNSAGESVIYSTGPYSDPYLRDILNSGDMYDNAFFRCGILISELPPDTYVLEVLVRGVENGKSIVSHTLIINDDGTMEYIP